MVAGIAHLSLSTGYILAGLFSCASPAAPSVTVTLQNNPPLINNEQSSAYLNRLRGSSISPTYGGEFPIVDGITSGAFQIEHNIDFTSAIRPLLHTACVSAEAIHITVTYAAVVYVDSRYPPGSCRYELTLAHEMRHVKTDVDTVNDFLPYIKQLAETTAAQWKNSGDVGESEVATAQKSMARKLSAILEQGTDSLQRARNLRQPLVDSHEEYRRVSNACPD